MADTVIDVGFNTDDLKSAMSGGGGGGDNEGLRNNIAGGFTTALKGAGVLAILTQIKVALDAIGFALGIISSLISFIVVKFVGGLFKFFDDPVRALLELGVFIVNKIVEGLNTVVKALNVLIPGESLDMPLLPEINTEEVLRLYDEAKEAAKMMGDTIINSATNLGEIVYTGVKTLEEKAQNSFNAYGDMLDFMTRRAKALASGDTTGIYTSGKTAENSYRNSKAGMSISPELQEERARVNNFYKYLSGD